MNKSSLSNQDEVSELPKKSILARQRRESESIVFDDGTNTFFWRAHTVTVLLIVIIGLIYEVFFNNQQDDLEGNVKRGIIAAAFMFLSFGITQAKDGPFIRPHPAFWRLVLCLSVLYELGLVFLLFQSVSYAREILTYVDPNLNKPMDYKSYGGSCTIWDSGHPNGPLHNVMDKMDGFVVAHLLGWLCKALILRDFWLTNIISFVFELLEYTFEHQLPNFSECWWDHWLLDFLFCNGLGIFIGLKLVRYLSIREYQWYGIWNIKSYRGKMKRVVGQFGPYSWVQFRWKPTDSLGRWLFVSLVTFMFLLAELNTFYLKFVLWVPPDHPFVLCRLFFILFMGAVGVREAYDFLSYPNNVLGQQAWIAAAIISTEFMIVVKFGPDTLSLPFPNYVKWFWITMIVLYVLWSIWKFQFRFPRCRLWFRQLFEYSKIGIDVSDSTSDFSEDGITISDMELRKTVVRKRVNISRSLENL